MAALSEAGIAGEIGAQVGRGDQVLRGAGLKPAGGPWVDTASSFAQGDAGNLASGLQVAGSSQLVLSDSDLAAGGLNNYTFAQPFTLDLGHGSTVPAAAADSALSDRFTADPADPVLGAEQLLAGARLRPLRERVPRATPAGVVVDPPPGGSPRAPSWTTLLAGLSGQPGPQPGDPRPALHPGARRRQPRARRAPAPGRARPSRGISRSAADRIALGRQQLSLLQPRRRRASRLPS